jgi:hypothetical protein
MSMLFLKVGALCVVHLASFLVVYGAALPAMPPSGHEPIPGLAGLLLVAIANSAAVCWIITRSDASRWRLAFALFLALCGIQTILAQVETLIFPAVSERLPQGFVARAVLAGTLHSALFASCAVWLCGRDRFMAISRRPMPYVEWLWRTLVAAAVFVLLYFTCGYFIAWRQPTLAAYYGGVDPGSFMAQMRSVVAEAPSIVVIQIARGAAWALLLAPIVRRLRCSRVESVLITAVLSGITSLVLLVPNPFMPFAVRMIHFVETITANILFGAFVGWSFSGNSGPERVVTARSVLSVPSAPR